MIHTREKTDHLLTNKVENSFLFFYSVRNPSFSYISRKPMLDGGSEIPLRVFYLGESSATREGRRMSD